MKSNFEVFLVCSPLLSLTETTLHHSQSLTNTKQDTLKELREIVPIFGRGNYVATNQDGYFLLASVVYFKFQELKDVLISTAMECLQTNVNFHLAIKELCTLTAPKLMRIFFGVQPKQMETTNTYMVNGVSVLHLRILIASKDVLISTAMECLQTNVNFHLAIKE